MENLTEYLLGRPESGDHDTLLRLASGHTIVGGVMSIDDGVAWVAERIPDSALPHNVQGPRYYDDAPVALHTIVAVVHIPWRHSHFHLRRP